MNIWVAKIRQTVEGLMTMMEDEKEEEDIIAEQRHNENNIDTIPRRRKRKRTTIVAVVGAGHCPGMCRHLLEQIKEDATSSSATLNATKGQNEEAIIEVIKVDNAEEAVKLHPLSSSSADDINMKTEARNSKRLLWWKRDNCCSSNSQSSIRRSTNPEDVLRSIVETKKFKVDTNDDIRALTTDVTELQLNFKL